MSTVLDFLVEVVARFAGVSIAALYTCLASGLRRSYRGEWRRLFEKYSGAYEWIDVLGLLVLVSVIGVACWLTFLRWG